MSITLLMQKSNRDLDDLDAAKLGKMPSAELRKLRTAVENSDILTPEEKEAITDGLNDYLGF